MNSDQVKDHIVCWLDDRIVDSGTDGYVVGVSGGIDSALTSTLAALTGRKVILLNMPINQALDQYDRSNEHSRWLVEQYDNVESYIIDLSESFNITTRILNSYDVTDLALINTASRLRMTTLYAIANTHNLLVCGTGNKIEDYGIGFFTKYGDGGVDVSPIADLMKSEVYELCEFLGVPQSIQEAIPTDGLWKDNRSDEEQIGASYDELEWALNYYDEFESSCGCDDLTERQNEVLGIYEKRHISTKHKMMLPPVCLIPKEIK
jgi:NAD+ synthase